jgi:hypothetical protein
MYEYASTLFRVQKMKLDMNTTVITMNKDYTSPNYSYTSISLMSFFNAAQQVHYG